MADDDEGKPIAANRSRSHQASPECFRLHLSPFILPADHMKFSSLIATDGRGKWRREMKATKHGDMESSNALKG